MKKEAPRKGGFPHLLCAVQNGGDPQNKCFWKCGNDAANALKKGLLPQKNNSDNCIQPQGKRMYEEGLLQAAASRTEGSEEVVSAHCC